jgi:hypothetical protein
MRVEGPERSDHAPVDSRLVAAGVVLLVAAGALFLPTGVGVEVSAVLVALACGGVAYAGLRTVVGR